MIGARLRRFLRARDGAAAIEFVGIMFFMVVPAWLTTAELVQLQNASSKTIAAADTLSDLVSQNASLTWTNLYAVAQSITQPLTLTPGSSLSLAVVSIDFDANGNPLAQWQCLQGTDISAATIAADIALAKPLSGTAQTVILAVVSLPYTPMPGGLLTGPQVYQQASFHTPRLVSQVAMPTGAPASCS